MAGTVVQGRRQLAANSSALWGIQAARQRIRSQEATRVLLLSGALAPVLFFPFVLLAGRMTPGYGHIASTFSDASAQGAPHPEIIVLGLVVTGCCLLLGGAGLARVLPGRQLLVQIGMSASALGIFATAVFQDYDRTSGVARNREGMLHNTFAIITVFAILITIGLISLTIRTDPGWRSFAGPAMAVFVIVSLAGIAFNFGPDSHDGLAERILAGAALTFLSALCLHGIDQLGEQRAEGAFADRLPVVQPATVASDDQHPLPDRVWQR